MFIVLSVPRLILDGGYYVETLKLHDNIISIYTFYTTTKINFISMKIVYLLHTVSLSHGSKTLWT